MTAVYLFEHHSMDSSDDFVKEIKEAAFTFIAVLNAEFSYVVAKNFDFTEKTRLVATGKHIILHVQHE